jgi:hypothetical protein
MRSIKELLQVMLDNQDDFRIGLCIWANQLAIEELIVYDEWESLRIYIDNNRPNKWSSLNAFSYRNTPLYWNSNNIKPRIKWIEKHIKLNS